MPSTPGVPPDGAALPAPQLGPAPEQLRAAYLQLLKLSLCDLTGACTRELRWTSDKRVFWRHLTDAEQVNGRAEGKDWPLDGLTMIGLRRLDDLQACVESVLADGVAGDLIEAGAWRGGASILIRSTLDAWGADDRTVWVADSFQGFPPPRPDGNDADREVQADMRRIDYLAPGLPAVKEHFARFGVLRGVRFLPGFFVDTLPALRDRRWALIRLDADTYDATKLTLESLYPGLEAGGYVLIDDYFHPYLPESCRRAVDEFRAEHGITDPIEQVDWNGAHWRKTAPAAPAPEASTDPHPDPDRDGGADASVAPGRELALVPTAPSDTELQLRDELHAVQAEPRTPQPESAPRRWRRFRHRP